MNPNSQYNTRSIYNLCIEQGLINKETCSYRDFYDVIREFHKGVSNKIIFNEYNFKINIGYFKVLRVARKGESINWGASKKRKQELIDSGLTPFNKTTALDGVKWFIYHEGDYYKWSWFKDKAATFIKNCKMYKFTPMTGNRRAVAKAVQLNPQAEYASHS